MFRTAVYLAAVVGGEWRPRPDAFHPTWVQLAVGALYALSAAALVLLGRRDVRAWSLGAFLGGFGCALMDGYIRTDVPLLAAAKGLRTDAFFSASLWFFCTAFPGPAKSAGLAATFTVGVIATAMLGVALAATDAVAAYGLAGTGVVAPVAAAVSRFSQGASDWFFTLQFLSMLPLLVLMRIKAREAGPDEKRRLTWLTMGIAIALTPLTLDVFVNTLWPGYHEWTRGTPFWTVRSAAIMTALAVLPPASAYSALVHRAVDIGFAFRAAAQYLVARYAVHALAATPVVLALFVVFLNRNQAIDDLLAGPAGLTLAVVALAAWAAGAGRHRLLRVLDTRFFRQAIDAQATFLSLADGLRRADSVEALADGAHAAIEGAFHPEALAICVEDSSGQFIVQNADVPSLAKASALAQIIGGDDKPLPLESVAPGVLARLPAPEQKWLRHTRPAVLLPMRSSGGDLLGVIAIGGRRSELPYSAEDLRLLTALGTTCGLAIERLSTAARAAATADGRTAGAGRECVECGEVLDGDAVSCTCGAPLQRAPVPRVLDERLRIERRIGAGGFAVVYSAIDLALKQRRAVKALPQADPAHFARLRREARIMSAVRHPNLATVFALETWGRSPLLVMELFEGGTLADRLRRGALPSHEVLGLGRQLASALVALHDGGIQHRDVKPSNIGFTTGGIPKLLDFGLARMAEVRGVPAKGQSSESTWSGLPTSGRSGMFRGTPAYASPEALMGADPSPADDVWGLGVTLIEAATGTHPFKAQTAAATSARVLAEDGRVERWLEEVPSPVRETLAALVAKDPGRRLAACRALAGVSVVPIGSGVE